MKKPRVIIWDIETPYLEARVWRPGQMFLTHDNLVPGKHEFSVLSFAAKELDGKEIIFESVEGQRDPRNDKKVITALWKLLDGADVIITQNGKKFDLPLVRGRFAKYKLGEPSPSKHIDTYQMGKKFGLPSTSLAYMTEFFCPELAKSKHKNFPGRLLWDECLAGNPKAWAEMRKYNKQDVRGTEGAYKAMAPYVNTGVDFSVYEDRSDWVCSCGSRAWWDNGVSYERAAIFKRYKCKACGKNRTESGKKNNLLSKDKLDSLKGKND